MDLTDIQKSAQKHYEENVSRYEHLAGTLEFMLSHLVKESRMKVHHVSARTKTLSSYLEKFNQKAHLTSIESVQDLVGGRIVTLFRSDIEEILGLLTSVFDVITTENKIAEEKENSFGYMSVHVICRLKASLRGPHYDGLHDIVFEIQLRTILMDAWADVSHYIDYKGQSSVPRELRKDFFALSALFYVADSSFERFYEGAKASKESAATEVARADLDGIALDADTLGAAMEQWFPDRVLSSSRDVSELMEEISRLTPLRTVGELHKLVTAHTKEVESKEKANPPTFYSGPEELPPRKPDSIKNDETNRFWDVGIVRGILEQEYPDFQRRRLGVPFLGEQETAEVAE